MGHSDAASLLSVVDQINDATAMLTCARLAATAAIPDRSEREGVTTVLRQAEAELRHAAVALTQRLSVGE